MSLVISMLETPAFCFISCFRVCFPWGCLPICFFVCVSTAFIAFCSTSAVSFPVLIYRATVFSLISSCMGSFPPFGVIYGAAVRYAPAAR